VEIVENIAATLKQLESVLHRDPDPADAQRTMPQLRGMLEDMERDGNRRGDPIREVFARLGDKWSPLLLLLLQMRSYRHATLWRLVGTVAGDGQISQRILRLRLRALERDGLLRRHQVDTHPPGVLYELTATGRELTEHIHGLMSWTRKHIDEIRRCQQRVDQETGFSDDLEEDPE
jgi:DNA-binding HxlR family transcriptional regulator